MKERRLQDLTTRLLINGFSALLVCTVIFLAEMGPFRWLFAAVVAVIVMQAQREYYGLVRQKGITPALLVGLIGALLYLFALMLPLAFLSEALLAVFVLAAFVYFGIRHTTPLLGIAATVFGLFYVAFPFGCFLRILALPSSAPFEASWWILFTIAVTKGADVGAYFVGTLLGKRKLAPIISPKKTVEGGIGAFLSAIAVGLLICYLGGRISGVFSGLSYLTVTLLAAAVGVMGQLGDLAESLLKRDAAVKDSHRIPGVGGVLDMVDSLLFTAPLVYFFLRIHYTS